MIRLIEITLNAAHPELPLAEAVMHAGAPSAVFIRGVPASVGLWEITSVAVAVEFPDGTLASVAAVRAANGVWIATIPASAATGRTVNGFQVRASGTDERGDAVEGYLLGVGDLAVCTLAAAPAPEPGVTAYLMRYFDAAPSPAKKGDVAPIGGVVKYYDGTSWLAFAAGATPIAPSTDPDAAGKPADAKATGDALVPISAIFQRYASNTAFNLILERNNNNGNILYVTELGTGGDGPIVFNTANSEYAGTNSRPCVVFGGPYGPTMAYLNDIAPQFSEQSTYAVGELVSCYCIIDGEVLPGSYLYKCTAAVTTPGAWDASHWTRATVEDVLAALRAAVASKAPLASPAFTGTPTAPTPASGDDSTKVATTAFVQAAVAGGGGGGGIPDFVLYIDEQTGNICYKTPDVESES